ncbi:hypothetical protein D1818_24860 [Aquimarina sp. BL5]|uniref:hypothetical protein n=1 Tax=Aquimarina sp. BL5 TaxID=1714860 RepID=UPI000E48A156|nr:hypothetical protein [Aquimarina sp. BL5]AXT53889.1 hypothetical protein D1818_24860 [Aquimarina sp. BL5]
MKYVSVIITFLVFSTLLSCKEEILLVSAVKEITVPGRPNQDQYVQYKIQFEVTKDDQNLKIEDITFPQLDVKKDKLRFDIMDVSSNSITKTITKKGKYLLNIRPDSELQNQMITTKKDEIVIFLIKNNKTEQIKISSFVEKTKRIR